MDNAKCGDADISGWVDRLKVKWFFSQDAEIDGNENEGMEKNRVLS